MFIKASIFYDHRGLSLYVFEMPSGLLIAILDLLRRSFEIFDCDRPGYIDIDLTKFSRYLNLARDSEAINISFGDIIKFQFLDLGSNLITRVRKMRFRKSSVPTFEWENYDLAFGIPSQEFKLVFPELAIPREPAIEPDEYTLHMYMSNKRLRFLANGRQITLSKEFGHYEISGAEIMQPVVETYSLDFASSYLKAVDMTDKVWMHRFADDTLLNCQVGQLGHVYFPLQRCS